MAELDPDRGAGHGPGEELALGADVEEAGPERQRDGDAGRDERDQKDNGVGELKGGVLVLRARDPEATAQQSRVGVQRIRAGDRDDDRADQKGESNRTEGHRESARHTPDERRQAGRSRTAALGGRPRCGGYAGMSAGGVMGPSWIAFWTLSSSAFSSAGMVRLSDW